MKVHFWKQDDGVEPIFLNGLGDGFDVSFGDLAPVDTEVLIKGFVSDEDVEGLDELRACIIPWAGLPDRTRLTFLKRANIRVYNLHHNAASTAETALALLMACARRSVPHDRLMREGNWAPRWSGDDAVQLCGHRMVVLGFGAIGQRICSMGLGLGMDVSAVRLTEPTGQIGAVRVYPAADLRAALDGARALICAVPLTERTKGMVGSEELAMMDKSGVVVNVSRGPVIEESALFEACRDGQLHGAGLDVWWKYPESGEELCRPGDQPWHELENVVMSPHVGGAHKENELERMTALADLVQGLAEDDVPANRVNLHNGY